MKINDKVIVVTGGGNGMGRELVLNLLSKGAKVIAADMNVKALEETKNLAEELKMSLLTVETNITDSQSVQNLLKRCIDGFGRIDGVINNAGIIQPFMKVMDTDYSIIERVFNVNLFGTINMIKVFLPKLVNQKESFLVNVSSMGGFLPVAGQAFYGASKAAVKLLSEALATELRDSGVNVITIVPGGLNTNIKVHSGIQSTGSAQKEDSSKTKALSPSIAAEIIVSAIEENKQLVFVGKDAKLMNLLYRFSPKMAINMIHNKMKSHTK